MESTRVKLGKAVDNLTRVEVLSGITALPIRCHRNFRLCFGRKQGVRTVTDALSMPLSDIVEEMSIEELHGALDLIDRTVIRLAEGGK